MFTLLSSTKAHCKMHDMSSLASIYFPSQCLRVHMLLKHAVFGERKGLERKHYG